MPIILILLTAFLFRFYNFHNLQYWSGDEEIASAVVRRMIFEKRLTLVSPNLAVNSLGSFFHILSVPLFVLTKLDPIKIELFMSFLGVITAVAVYKAGKILLDARVAFAASLLYSASFVIALFDRRWWPLGLNQILATLAIISLFKIISLKKYKYSIILAACIGFAANADPTIAVIAIVTILSFLFLKIPLMRKEYLAALITLAIFVAPIAIFEIRHPGSITKPLSGTIIKTVQEEKSKKSFSVVNPIPTFSRLYFSRASNFAERHFCYCRVEDLTHFPSYANLLILALLFYPLYRIVTQKKLKERKLLVCLYFFPLAFIFGSTLYTFVYGNKIFDHYYTIIFPAVSIILGYSLATLIKSRILLATILTLFVIINLQTLLRSSFKYPLYEKNKLVSYVADKIGSSDFSLYSVGGDYMHGGGFTSLFILQDKHPKKSYIYPFYDWMYKAYSLYTVDPQTADQKKIVLIGSKNNFTTKLENIEYEKTINNLKTVILDNSEGKFSEKSLPAFGTD